MKTGLIFGNRGGDARFLQGIPFAKGRDIAHYQVPTALQAFDRDHAERPRDRATYRAPLVLVKEFLLRGMKVPRPIVAVAERDTVYTDTHFDASFRAAHAFLTFQAAS